MKEAWRKFSERAARRVADVIGNVEGRDEGWGVWHDLIYPEVRDAFEAGKDAKRHEALVAAKIGEQHKECAKHPDIMAGIEDGCVVCALDLGNREGSLRAGLYYTHEEVFDDLVREGLSSANGGPSAATQDGD